MRLASILATGLIAATLATQASAADDGCRFKGPLLYCLDGDRTLESLVTRFGSDATTDALRNATDLRRNLPPRAARERYRVSVERNNARAVRFSKRADRAFRRRRIDADEYDRRMALYNRAYSNYRIAIERYQRSYWFDPVADAPLGPDLPAKPIVRTKG